MVLICLQDGEGIREEGSLLAVMISFMTVPVALTLQCEMMTSEIVCNRHPAITFTLQ